VAIRPVPRPREDHVDARAKLPPESITRREHIQRVKDRSWHPWSRVNSLLSTQLADRDAELNHTLENKKKMSRSLLNIETRSLPRLMLSVVGVANKDAAS
jgi:hypothetical protein